MFNLTGKKHSFTIGEKTRQYITVTLPFSEASQVFKPEVYSAASGRGEQRMTFPSQVNKLRKELEAGNFTPTTLTAGVKKSHKELITEDAEGNVTISVNPESPLPLTDGGHRMAALQKIKEEGKLNVDNVPLTFMVMLDGHTQRDFLNLQSGRPVDKSHMLSLKIQNKLVDKSLVEDSKRGLEIARELHNREDSPFHKSIRFDTKSKAALPLSSLFAQGKSDSSTSLIGLARVTKGIDVKEVVQGLVNVYGVLEEKYNDCVGVDGMYAPPPDGTKGSATNLIGLAVLYFAKKDGNVDKLARVAAEYNDTSAGFSSSNKRFTMNAVAESYLTQAELDGLYQVLSPSAYGVKKEEKEVEV